MVNCKPFISGRSSLGRFILTVFSSVKETDPQIFTPDATFWHDMSSYICTSPKSHYDYNPSDPSASPEDGMFKVAARGSRRVRSKEQSPEVILVSLVLSKSYQPLSHQNHVTDKRFLACPTFPEELPNQNEIAVRTRDFPKRGNSRCVLTKHVKNSAEEPKTVPRSAPIATARIAASRS
jgi:hypothetical protein